MKRGRLTEREASFIVRDIANGLNFLHSKGMSHRFVEETCKQQTIDDVLLNSGI